MLLHALSDQQLVTGISLLIATESKACQISAYHYNLVCAMILMSIITHLKTLLNAPHFFREGYVLVAILRLVFIFATVVFGGILFSSRNTAVFPADAGSLSILPAACFENKNGSQGLGFGEFASDIASNTTMATDQQRGGFVQYMLLSGFCVFAVIVLLIYSLESCFSSPGGVRRMVTLILRGIATMGSLFIVSYAIWKYKTLRQHMEVPEWYQVGITDDDWTFTQLLPYALLGSSLIPVVKALEGNVFSPIALFCGLEAENRS